MAANEIEIMVSTKEQASEGLRRVRKDADETRDSFDRVGEASDELDTKAMGFRDTLTGVQDSMKGTSLIAQGDLFTGFLTLGMGVGDLGSGMYNFLVPAFKAVAAGGLKTATTMVASSARQVAAWIRLSAQAMINAIRIAAAWVISLGPIALVIAALVAVGAAFVVLWKKSETFRNIMIGVWRTVRSAVGSAINGIIGFFRRVPGALSSAFSRVVSIITSPFRAALNGVRSIWNSTLGGRGLSIPSWVPFVGGKSFTFPYLQHGGIGGGFAVVGEAGPELVRLPQGSTVKNNSESRGMLSNGAGEEVHIHLHAFSGEELAEVVWDPMKRKIWQRGGKGNSNNVQVALGS